jgi:hypothetical protein
MLALAAGLLLVPAMLDQARAGHGGMGGGHFGGMGGAHFGGMGGAHFGGMGNAHFHGMGNPHFAGGSPHVGNWHGGHLAYNGNWQGDRHMAWNGGPGDWHGHNAWHDHDHFHEHFAHNHHFNDHFVGAGIGLGWWPGYYAYGYGYGGCRWLYRNAVVTGDPYWWDRYYACTAYDYY